MKYNEQPKTHYLKILPMYYKAVVEGLKDFEVRYDDRNFRVGDWIILEEFEKGEYTGIRSKPLRIKYILHAWEKALSQNWVILGLKNTYGEKGESQNEKA